MSLWRIYRLVRRLYALLVLLAAASGIGPGTVKAPPASTAAPAPPPPTHHVIGSCATGTDGKLWFATCVVDGRSVTFPGVYASHALAVQAIRDYRAANA